MMLDRYFITSLPALGDLGTLPPMGFAELWEWIADHRRIRELAGALLLMDDLRQRESHLAGELDYLEPTVLSLSQTLGRSPLPAYLVPEPDLVAGSARRIAADQLWETYFRYAADLAETRKSLFLAAWVGHEVALRNALAAARAERLGLEPAGYLVAPELAQTDDDFGPLLSEWAAATSPLMGQQRLLRAKWVWIEAHDPHFTFDDDELLVYTARLILLRQWQRIAGNE